MPLPEGPLTVSNTHPSRPGVRKGSKSRYVDTLKTTLKESMRQERTSNSAFSFGIANTSQGPRTG
jgi:hypothetical protein